MKILKIEVSKQLHERIQAAAKSAKVSEEEFIKKILKRFSIDSHIMESKEVEEGYKECGDINLEIANS